MSQLHRIIKHWEEKHYNCMIVMVVPCIPTDLKRQTGPQWPRWTAMKKEICRLLATFLHLLLPVEQQEPHHSSCAWLQHNQACKCHHCKTPPTRTAADAHPYTGWGCSIYQCTPQYRTGSLSGHHQFFSRGCWDMSLLHEGCAGWVLQQLPRLLQREVPPFVQLSASAFEW